MKDLTDDELLDAIDSTVKAVSERFKAERDAEDFAGKVTLPERREPQKT